MKTLMAFLLLASGWLAASHAAAPPTNPAPAAAAPPAPPAAAPKPLGAMAPPAIPAPPDYSGILKLEGTNLINRLNALRAEGKTNLADLLSKQLAAKLTNAAAATTGRAATNLVTGRATPLTGGTNLLAGGTNALTGRGGLLASFTNAPAGGTNAEEVITPGVIRFQAADLNAVLEVYAELVQRTILRPATLPDTKITLKNQTPLTKTEAIRALAAVLNMNQITLIDVGDKFVKVVPQAQAFPEAKPATDIAEVPEMPDLSGFITVIRQLTNAKPSEVVNALQPFAKMQGGVVPIDSSGIIVLRDYGDNVKRMMEMLDKIDVAVPLEVEPVVIPIQYALAGDIAQVLGQLTAGGSVTTTGSGGASRGLSRSTSTGMRSTTSPYGSNIPGQPGYNPYGAGTTGGITPQANPGTAQTDFQKRISSIVAKATGSGDIQVLGQAKIIADERINALLVFADKRDRDMITNIISKLDVVLAQVLIEALIIEVSLNDNEEHGISYLQRAITSGKYSSAGAMNTTDTNPFQDPTSIGGAGTNLASGFSYFMKWGHFDLAAKAAASDGRISVLSRPRIQTSHAVEANLFVGETRPYPTGSSYGGYYGGYSQIQQMQIGIELAVLPLINPNGLVVMEIRQRVQNVGDMVTIENVGQVPTTVDRTANAKVAVNDGQTIILGGFISADHAKNRSGVPVLMNIPGIGSLFRSKSEKRTRKELMVFIRPTVLKTPEAASELATTERAKVTPITQVERQFEMDEARHVEEVERDLNKLKDKKRKSKSGASTSGGLQSFPVN